MTAPLNAVQSNRFSIRTVVLGSILAVVVLTGLVWVRVWPDQVAAISNWVRETERAVGPTGWLVAMGLQVLIALCGVLPASVGPITAGVVFGSLTGFLICAPATMAGAIIAFLLSRSLFRSTIDNALRRRPYMMRLDEAIARDGWRLVCLMRISPVMPFAATSYALGLTSLGLKEYVLGSLASLPALFLYVLMGDLTGAGLTSLSGGQAGVLHWCLLGLAIAATALLTFRIGVIVKRVVKLPDLPTTPHQSCRNV